MRCARSPGAPPRSIETLTGNVASAKSQTVLRGVTFESPESPLGRWTAAHWTPPPGSPLYGAVERIWYFDGIMTHPNERVFPDGTAELIVMLDEPAFSRTHWNGSEALCAHRAIR